MADGAQQPAGRGRARWYDALVGEVLDGRYQLGKHVGHGGMGAVFQAWDLRLRRMVAVKVLDPGLVDDDPRALSRFRAEALLVAGLADHPCLVEVYDTNDEDDQTGLCYIAMQFVAGQTLDKVLAAGPLSVERAVRVVGDVLSALGHAHAGGVVHRDVKPGNVMVADDGRVKVVDFGIARAVDGTVTTKVLGTPGYMAPEQALNKPVDARTDLYAAGCVLFAVLTGGPPFVGDSAVAVVVQHLSQPPPAPSGLRPGLPEGVDAVVARALAKEPDDRYQSAEEFRSALEALVVSDPGPVGRGPSSGELPLVPPSFPPAVHDGRTVKAPQPVRRADAEGTHVTPGPAGDSDRPAPAAPSQQAPEPGRAAGGAPGPVERLGRLGGLVDYRTRVPSTARDVTAVCHQIAGSTWSSASSPVRLSGIDWRVLKVETSDGRALLLADRVIGTGSYNKVQEATAWERCDLRDWLNEDFARSLGEPLTSRVARVKVHNGPNPVWGTAGGNDTTDQFFLLSMEEAADWLAGQKSVDWKKFKRKGWFTSDKLIAKNEDDKIAWWWLRSPGYYPDDAAFVDYDGSLSGSWRVDVSWSGGGVRPAFWLNL